MFKLLIKFISLFNAREKKQFYLLIVQSAVNAVLQTISLISIFPFIAVVASPSLIETNSYVAFLYGLYNFNTVSGFLLALGILIFILIVLSNLSMIYMLYRQKNFIKNYHVDLSSKLLQTYFHQDYLFFVQRNSTDLTKRIIEDVRYVAEKYVVSLIDFIVSGLMSLSIVLMILIVDPFLTLFVISFIGVFYGGIYLFMRKKINMMSYEKTIAQKLQYKSLIETFGAIKEIKISDLEQVFLKNFTKFNSAFVNIVNKVALYTKIPGYALDIITFGGLIAIVLYFLYNENNVTSALPIITLYALSAQRLKPQVQLMFASVAHANFTRSSLELIEKDINSLSVVETIQKSSGFDFSGFKNIQLTNLNFSYPSVDKNVINDLNLNIKNNTTVALVGHSGSGKTTLVDLILGVLKPTSGKILVDETEINNSSVRDWQKVIGYIPQHIFLFDDTIRNNIILDKSRKYDTEKLNRILKMSGLTEFVEQAKDGVDTIVGDKGVKLSGGQRQRIGIARALYKEPALLIMDEGTSALDGITEDKVMSSIYELSGKITIIIIAHRLTTIKDCDVIHFMKDGKIIQSAAYNFMLEINPDFRNMAKENPIVTSN